MKKYSNIILTIVIIALLGACEDSLGTDPDYKTTIFDKDTVLRIDTVIQIDTVLRDDSYIFTVDSLITVTDSLGNVIDSLSRVISDSTSRPVAPRFQMVVDSIYPSVTYMGLDTILDVNQQPATIRTMLKSYLFPIQRSKAPLVVEMDTNLSNNRAWVNFVLDGRADLIDSNPFTQHVFMDTTIIRADSVLIYNNYTLREGLNNYTFSAMVRDYNLTDISNGTQKLVSMEFINYLFDNESKLIGYSILVEIDLEARGTQLSNPQSNYQFRIDLSYP